MLKKLLILGAAVVTLGQAEMSQAASFNEGTDSGETLDTAQILEPDVTTITGFLKGLNADLFKFSWGGGLFDAKASGSSFDLDTQLFLFDKNGLGVIANDDDDNVLETNGESRILLNLAAGSYYLGISGFDYDPVSAKGLIFEDSDEFFGTSYPILPGGNLALEGWEGFALFDNEGEYVISLSSSDSQPTDVTSVPEPGSIVGLAIASLLGIGLKRYQK